MQYTSYSVNITSTVSAHDKGEVSFTRDKPPVRLVHLSLFSTKQKAYDFERYLNPARAVLFEIRD
jgi:putative endonuclease